MPPPRLRNARLALVPIYTLAGRHIISVPAHSTVQDAKDGAARELRVENVELVEVDAVAPLRAYTDDGAERLVLQGAPLLHALHVPLSLKLCVSFGGWLQVVPRAVVENLRDSDTLAKVLDVFQGMPMVGQRCDDFVGEQMWDRLQRVPRGELQLMRGGGEAGRTVTYPLQVTLGRLRDGGSDLHLTFDLERHRLLLFISEADACAWAELQDFAAQLDPYIDVDAEVDRHPSVDAWVDHFLATF
jgi:hypothetical protein